MCLSQIVCLIVIITITVPFFISVNTGVIFVHILYAICLPVLLHILYKCDKDNSITISKKIKELEDKN